MPQLGSAPQVLQVPRGARKEVLDLRPGTRYHAQVRAQPSGPWYQGSWSAWSKPVVVDAVGDTGKGQGRAGGCGQRSRTADRRRRVLEMGWEHRAEGDGAAKGSEVGGLRRATVPALLLRCRLAHPQCHDGAAAPLSSASGAAVHLPLPLQVKVCARGSLGGPAPSLGTLTGHHGTPNLRVP